MKINTIEMTRTIRDKHAQRLGGKSHAERIAFYRERAKKMEKKIQVLLSRFAVAESKGEYNIASKLIHDKCKSYKKSK